MGKCVETKILLDQVSSYCAYSNKVTTRDASTLFSREAHRKNVPHTFWLTMKRNLPHNYICVGCQNCVHLAHNKSVANIVSEWFPYSDVW